MARATDPNAKHELETPRNPPPKASAFLADRLRADIIGNDLPVGGRLPSEADLIEQFSLSRATVREALRLLESEGLIAIKRGPNGGIAVTSPDAGHISRTLATMVGFSQVPLADLFSFRIAIEPPAASAAAERIDADSAAQLLSAAEHHEHGTQERVDFHLLIAQLSGNALFETILAALHDVLTREVDFEQLTEKDREQTVLAHVRIAKAIGSGDAAKSEKAMRLHLEGFAKRMEEAGRLGEPIIPRSAWLRSARSL